MMVRRAFLLVNYVTLTRTTVLSYISNNNSETLPLLAGLPLPLRGQVTGRSAVKTFRGRATGKVSKKKKLPVEAILLSLSVALFCLNFYPLEVLEVKQQNSEAWLTVNCTRDFKRRVRISAGYSGMTVARFIREAVTEKLNRENREVADGRKK